MNSLRVRLETVKIGTWMRIEKKDEDLSIVRRLLELQGIDEIYDIFEEAPKKEGPGPSTKEEKNPIIRFTQ